MKAKGTDLKRLEELYNAAGNGMAVVYGKKDGGLRQLLKEFVSNKKFFYYYCRQVSAEEQCRMMGMEIEKKYDVRLQNHTYQEYFKRIKSGDASKLVVIIDEAQYLLKKDPSFFAGLLDLKARKLYPGPVLIVLVSSSLVWVEQELEDAFVNEYKKVDLQLKIDDLNFLDVVRLFEEYSVPEIIRLYGVLGGVSNYLRHWNTQKTFKENICDLILEPDGFLFHKAEEVISAELRELSVYNTILGAIAAGNTKLNDLYEKTGYSRAKISVYMKNLSYFDIIEKVQSFETGGWDNAKKGVYQIKDTFINFWYKFVFPHQSDLYLLTPSEYYDTYIRDELDEYLNRYFQNVCREYLYLLNQMRRLPLQVTKLGTWVGKTGNIDIIAQSSDRQNIVGLCNWEKPMLTVEMLKELLSAMHKAKITSEHFYLFSAKSFEPELVEMAKADRRIELIDMNEL